MTARGPLPPPLLVTGDIDGAARSADPDVSVRQEEGCDVQRTEAFGALLATARRERGVGGRLSLFAAGDPACRPPPPAAEQVWLPHMFCWRSREEPAIAWELADEAYLPALIEASSDDVQRWARRPDLLLRLCHLAGDVAPSAEPRRHLSLRWLLANQEMAAAALAAESVDLEHVSLHVDAADEEALVGVLTTAIGLVEIPRPSNILVPGRWLQAGNCRLHLNSRAKREGEQGFPGTAPNHVCFAVADLSAVVRAVERLGFETEQAGSLSRRQIWLRLPGEIVIELQPRPD